MIYSILCSYAEQNA